MTAARKGRTAPDAGDSRGWIAYNFAVLRAVPHVHIGAFAPVGIVLHARTTEFLGVRVITDTDELRARAGEADVEMLSRYLESCHAIGMGEMTAGPIAFAPPSERFHWLTAPRSDVIQSGPVHEGLCEDPATELGRLFMEIVQRTGTG
ncbi:MAG: DUF3037 domain-containing protein [Gemmatimonadaceae bacterium]|nr:DUF3037 domain-containing protein [Gemmatimonadaceae bacterium]